MNQMFSIKIQSLLLYLHSASTKHDKREEQQTFCLRESSTASVLWRLHTGRVSVAVYWGLVRGLVHQDTPPQHLDQKTVPPCLAHS